VEDLLISTLETFGFPVMLQGSLLADEPYPDSFFTFWNASSSDGTHYNNTAVSIVYYYNVYFYSTDPARVYKVLRDAIAALKSVGFIISGDGFSVASDEPTHDGRGVNVEFLKF
jgi:hypothetical protein